MAAGEYESVSSHVDTEAADRVCELAEPASNPDGAVLLDSVFAYRTDTGHSLTACWSRLISRGEE